MRSIHLVVFVVLVAACGDDGNNNGLADAPQGADSIPVDAAVDATPDTPGDIPLVIASIGSGDGVVTSDPAGIDCGSGGATCTASFPPATVLTLTATPDASSVFAGWGGACSGTTPVCEVTLADAASATATFTLKTYTVSVSKPGAGTGTIAGTGLNCGPTCSIVVDHGTAISLTATPSNASGFAGWGGACTGTAACVLTITEDTAITAAFTLDDTTLVVATGGNGSGTVTSSPAGVSCPGDCEQTFTANATVTLTPTAAASSTFTGWAGACSGTGACVVTMNAAKTATANFTLKKYALTVAKAGSGTGSVTSSPAGITCGAACTAQYDHGALVTLTATAAGGSSFTGWGGACAGSSPTCTLTIDAAKNATATFAILTYALEVMKLGNGSGTISSAPAGIACPGDCSQVYTYDTDVTLTATAATGTTFTGWMGDCTGAAPTCVLDMKANKAATGMFTLQQFALTVVSAHGMVASTPSGITCPGVCSASYNYGTSVTLSALPDSGYDFTGWTGGCTGTGPCVVSVTAATTVTATYALQQHALTVTKSGTGTGLVSATGISCGADCTETYDHNSMVALTPVADASSTFTGWSGACTGAGACTVTMDAAKSVTAAFTVKQIKLTVMVDNGNAAGAGTVTGTGGFSCTGTCSQMYPYNTAVSLTAAASTGSMFISWSGGGCAGNVGCTTTLTADVVITAKMSAPNLVFVSSTTHAGTFGDNNAFAYADNVCNTLAAQAGLLGAGPGKNTKFKAFLSSQTDTAAARLAGYSGWMRVDGRPVVRSLADFATNTVYYPIRLDQNGAEVGVGQIAWTGSKPDGTYSGDACKSAATGQDWRSASNLVEATGGLPTNNSESAVSFNSANCATPRPFLCFGIDRAAEVAFAPVTGRIAFTSVGKFDSKLGIDAADALCQSEATTAGLAGQFRALLATSTTSAVSRFTGGSTWVRRKDGVPIANTAAAFLAGPSTIESAPNATAQGARVGDIDIWTGAGTLGGVGSLNGTCDNWSQNTGGKATAGHAGDTGVARWWFGGNAIDAVTCAMARSVVCLQR